MRALMIVGALLPTMYVTGEEPKPFFVREEPTLQVFWSADTPNDVGTEARVRFVTTREAFAEERKKWMTNFGVKAMREQSMLDHVQIDFNTQVLMIVTAQRTHRAGRAIDIIGVCAYAPVEGESITTIKVVATLRVQKDGVPLWMHKGFAPTGMARLSRKTFDDLPLEKLKIEILMKEKEWVPKKDPK